MRSLKSELKNSACICIVNQGLTDIFDEYVLALHKFSIFLFAIGAITYMDNVARSEVRG